MKTIYKFHLNYGRTEIWVPEPAEILTAQMQHGLPTIWVLLDDEMECEKREIAVYGTGTVLPDDPGIHQGTVQDDGLVWHIFELWGK